LGVNAEGRSLEDIAAPLWARRTSAAGHAAASGLTGGLTARVRRDPDGLIPAPTDA
jgi:hypothetical protein